jgi:hypothetical protein
VKETLRTLGYSNQEADVIIDEMMKEIERGVPRPELGQGVSSTTRPSEARSDPNDPAAKT